MSELESAREVRVGMDREIGNDELLFAQLSIETTGGIKALNSFTSTSASAVTVTASSFSSLCVLVLVCVWWP